MNVLFILASLSALVAVLGIPIVSDNCVNDDGVVNQQCYFLQNTTYPSCGDCVFSDFRGDAGATGPQVYKQLYAYSAYMWLYYNTILTTIHTTTNSCYTHVMFLTGS